MRRLRATLEGGTPGSVVQLRGRTFTPRLLRLTLEGDGLRGEAEVTPWPPGAPLDEAGLRLELAEHGPLELSAIATSELPALPSEAPVLAQLAAATARLSPRLAFAAECALLDALARAAELPAASLLAAGGRLREVPCSLLVPLDAVGLAGDAAARGLTVLKVKLGGSARSFPEELRALTSLRAALPDHVLLRLDANGGLPSALLREHFAALAPLGIELVEEPVSGAALLRLPPLPLGWAPDESLLDPTLAARLLRAGPAAIVLKPAALGLVRAARLARDAARGAIPVIFTHAFGGRAELAAARALAAAHDGPLRPCGLGEHAGLPSPLPTPAWLPIPRAPGLREAA